MTSPEPAEAVRAGNRARGLTVTHQCPPDGSQVTPCCGQTPFDLPRTDRITLDPALVTCFIRPLELTDEQIERFKTEWERKRHGHPKVLGLPRRVRFRLAVTGAIDSTAIWLAGRKRYRAAELLWRAFRMWR